MSEDTAVCACSRVRPRRQYSETDPGRVLKEWWECEGCGTRFAKQGVLVQEIVDHLISTAKTIRSVDDGRAGNDLQLISATYVEAAKKEVVQWLPGGARG